LSDTPLFVTIVLDGVGVGAQPDAADYGDAGSHTLGHVCAAERPHLPNLASLGLGLIESLSGVEAVEYPTSSWGRMEEQSAGKDSTTGHWELAGLHLSEPFPTYPTGFPEELLARFLKETGASGILGNEVASGTDIVERLGEQHVRSGLPIVYTSADSVFQVAAHVDRIPIEVLYAWCQVSREKVCTGEHAVGRVIARPFTGPVGAFTRLSDQRKDFSLPPPEPALQQRLKARGVRTVSVGKVSDLFAGVGFDETQKTGRNDVGIRLLVERIRAWDGSPTFIWVNLIDFDQEFGHRNNPGGFALSLEEFDRALPTIQASLPEGAGLLITADHGNDPTYPGTDHTREYVPILFQDGRPGRDLGTRTSFADHAATVLQWFGEVDLPGAPFGTVPTS
jgi:phosphopentomutase